MKKVTQLLFLALFFGIVTILPSCDEEEDPVFTAPSISIVGDNSAELMPGENIEVNFNINAEGGLSKIIVNRNGGFLEEVELTDPNATTFTYTGQTVPTDSEEAGRIEFEFIGENVQGTRSAAQTFTVTVNVYETISVGSTELFNVSSLVPDDGVVKSGTTVKLAANRSYYMGAVGLPNDTIPVSFEEGSDLVIEEGVTVYMQSGIDFDVTVFGSVNIEGTATAPIVMTSEHTLNTGSEPEAGDWNDFQIEGAGKGTNSGILKYVRIEYAGDRAFILDDVGNGIEVSHVQVWKCTDEGIFIAGGDVNVSNLVVTDSEDTQYRLDDDYSGNMQYILAVISLQDDGDESMYLRGDSEALISNVTVVGPGLIDGIGEPDGLRFWSTRGNKVYNAIVAELPSFGVRAEENATDGRPLPTDIDGPVVFAHSFVFNTEIQDDATGNLGRDDASVFFTDAGFNNSTDPVAGIGPIDFVPDAAPTSSFDPSTLGTFFQAATFAGAVENASNDWTTGWVKDPDGTVR